MSDTVRIQLQNDWVEGDLMKAITEIIQGSRYTKEIPFKKTEDFWTLDTGNNWWASLIRKGNVVHFGEEPVLCDTLELRYRYGDKPLLAIQPWLEYRFGPIQKF
jgi:hypothetical protein